MGPEACERGVQALGLRVNVNADTSLLHNRKSMCGTGINLSESNLSLVTFERSAIVSDSAEKPLILICIRRSDLAATDSVLSIENFHQALMPTPAK
jgi:hypothetical protein